MNEHPVTVFWFRRDLRLHDNHALYRALAAGNSVQPLFIYDTNILDLLESNDSRIGFIRQSLQSIQEQLHRTGASLWVHQGSPLEVFKELTAVHKVEGVYANEDYEPYAIQRDQTIKRFLEGQGIPLHLCTDHLLMAPGKVLKEDGTPYTVYTPFMKRWRAGFEPDMVSPYPSEKHLQCLRKSDEGDTLVDPEGFTSTEIRVPSPKLDRATLIGYKEYRDRPDLDATSYLSPHLRFGTVSVREAARASMALSVTFVDELIWRDFFAHILFHFPQVEKGNFKKGFNHFPWLNREEDIARWTTGTTGFPIVDAGMRQLVQTGWMHNRVRMITASFLVKDLLVDWRIGEAFFAQHLLDFELASNNGNWQWAAGTGCDAAPFFRIFNPTTQQKRFDPELQYIRRWIPEYGTGEYPKPMVNHDEARKRALVMYKKSRAR
jgi:deoxyribodipyrimidine photo-lyase